ncbi:hypothetical protein KJ554_12420 [bacterium]|nr:hypothetical protein [bacterium]
MKSPGRQYVLTGTSLLCAIIWLTAATDPPVRDAPHAPRTDYRADRLVDRVVDGEKVTWLIGNVVVVRDSLTVRGDSAAFYGDRDEYEFFGDVRMTRAAAVLTCRRAVYHGTTEEAEFYRQVRLEEGDMIATSDEGELREGGDRFRLMRSARLVTPEYVVWADTITRWDEEDRGEASGRVKIVDPERANLVTGEHALFYRQQDLAIVDRAPNLTSREQGRRPLRAVAEVMYFHHAEKRVVMVDSVRIYQGTTSARADTAVIHGQDRVVLTGAPELDDGEGSTMDAEEIEFVYLDGELDRVHLRREARVVDHEPSQLAQQYLGLPGTDELTGDDITVFFADEVPDRSVVVGNAHSVYVPLDVAEEVAFNDVTGDTIVIAFQDGKVRQVDVMGGMSGVYSFLRLAELGAVTDRAAALLDSLATAGGDSVPPGLPGGTSGADPTALLTAMAAGDAAAAPADTTFASLLADSTLAAVLADSALVGTLMRAASDTLSDGRRTWDFGANRQKVEYEGDAAIFDLAGRQIHIAGNANLVYGSLDLTAGKVRMDLQTRELYAEDKPLLVDASQKIAGRQLGYGFEHRTGAVREGATAMDEFFYVGEEIKRFDDGTLKIRSGKMTSCDLAEPHYHFWADKMKIRPGDKVVAKPIVMKIGEVPVFALPFYFKALETGRKSGILFPNFNFGWSERTGRYIRDWGYYWATSDYTDFTVRGDYNENRELTWQVSNRYVKRYSFTGNVDYSRRNTLGEQAGTREWQLRWNHSQETLFDYYRFRSSVQMSSKTISREDLISDVGRDVISGQQTSTIYLSRNWSNLSATLNFKRDEFVNREDDDLGSNNLLSTQSFPQLKLTFKSTSLLPALRTGQKGNVVGNLLRSTYLSHNYDFSSARKSYETTDNTLHSARGSASLSLKQQRLLFLTASTGVGGSYSWTREEDSGTAYVLDPDTNYVAEDVRSIAENNDTGFSINSAVSAKLYGLFRPKIGRLRAIRHTFGFNVSHRLSPSIPGKQIRSESFGLSVNNRFDAKYLAGSEADSIAEYKKLDGIIDWGLSTGYSPDRDPDSRWQTISSSLTVKPGQNRNLKVTVNQSIDPYAMRVTSTRIVYGLSFNGRVDTGGEVLVLERERNSTIDLLGIGADSTAVVDDEEAYLFTGEQDGRLDDADEAFPGFAYFGAERADGGRDETGGGRYIPWRLGSNFSYSKDHISDNTTARVSLSFGVTLTRNWQFDYRTSYDIERGTLTNQTWNLSRDLHCWQLRFSRTVNAVDSQFGFILSLKSIPDVKVTRGKEDMVSGYGRATSGLLP